MTVNLIQVGLGGWGRSWARTVLPIVDEIEPVAYVELSPEARAFAQKDMGISPELLFGTLDEALAAKPCHAVLVTTPIAGHVQVGLEALAAGKHVLIEKPLAMTADEARQVVDAAEEQGLIAMVSQNYRHFPAPRKAADLVRSRALGRPQQVAIEFRRNLPNGGPPHWKLKQPLLVDMAIHQYDLMRMILQDEPVEVYCRTWNPPGSPYEDMPAAAAIIRFAGGPMVTYQGNWASRGKKTFWAGEWRMECDEGDIIWTSRAGGSATAKRDRLAIKPTGRPVERISLAADGLTGRAAGLQIFAQAIETGEMPAIASTAADNLGSIRFMQAMIESAATGQPVHL